ncbi:MAG: DUF4062 domain-containing protein [Motiliproteus sp.]
MSQCTFRLFVSSTFSDMVAERNALQQRVFPRLRQLAAARGWRFQPVDLRWGVSEEASLDQRAMPICLEELRRCQQTSPKPNFLILLGDRYGWRPLPYRIPVSEYKSFLALADPEEEGLLQQWYRQDNNTVPPAYILKPRQGEFADYVNWEKVERRLRSFFVAAVTRLGLQGDQQVPYTASATEQEILAGTLQVADAADHVVCCIREITNLPENDSAADFTDQLADGTTDDIAQKQLSDLKARLQTKLEGRALSYQTCWQEAGLDTSYLDQFCEDVYSRLEILFKTQMAATEQVAPLDRELLAQASFKQQRSSVFIGQLEALDLIQCYLDKPEEEARPLSFVQNREETGCLLGIVGVGGSGKSALMAKVIQDAEQVSTSHIIYRFIGATPSSSNLHSLIAGLHRQVSQAFGVDKEPPSELDELVESFNSLLREAGPEQPLHLFLDALDQLSPADNARRLSWLPIRLPPHVYLIVSVLSGPIADTLRGLVRSAFPSPIADKLSSWMLIELKAMSPSEGTVLLESWLSQAGRTLQASQQQAVLDSFNGCGLPLYLKLAVEEAKRWTSWQEPQTFGSDVDGIINDLFTGLEKEHGTLLTQCSLGYLAAARNGLTEDEMLDLLSGDEELFQNILESIHHDLPEQRLPAVLWSRFYEDLAPYLTERQADGATLITFFHRQLAEVARNTFLTPAVKDGRHQHLAHYFAEQPLLGESGSLDKPNARKTAELPYQYAEGRQEQELEQLLTNFEFVITKCAADQLEGLVQDYDRASQCLSQPGQDFLLWNSFLNSQLHILRKGNKGWSAYKILLQLAIEHADDSPVTLGAEAFLAEGKCNWAWLRLEHRPRNVSIDPCLAVMEAGHNLIGVHALSGDRFLSWGDGLLLWRNSGKTLEVLSESHFLSVHLLPDGRFLSQDYVELRLWANDGKPLVVMRGDWDVSDVHLLPDGRFLSRAYSGELGLWANDGKPLAVMKSKWAISGVHPLPDGRFLSWAMNGELRLWASDGELLVVMKGHKCRLQHVHLLPDGRFLSWEVGHGEWRLWANDGKALAVRRGKITLGKIFDDLNPPVEMLRDEIISSPNRFLWWFRCVIDMLMPLSEADKRGLTIRRRLYMEGGRGRRRNMLSGDLVYFLPDGCFLSYSLPCDVRLFTSDGKLLVVLDEGTGNCSLRPLSDGRALLCGSSGDLRLIAGRKSLAVLIGHEANVLDTHPLPDGRFLSWDSWGDLRLWTNDGRPLAVMKHRKGVGGIHSLSDGRFLSWAESGELRLWASDGSPLAVLGGHQNRVLGCLLLPCGRLLSWSEDRELRLWAGDSKILDYRERHEDRINGFEPLSDGRFLSWSEDGDLRLWASDGKCVAVLEGHENGVKGCHPLLDGRFLSWSEDGNLRLWASDGKSLAVLVGHTSGVKECFLLPGGRFLSYSEGEDLRLWANDGKPFAVMKLPREGEGGGHTFRILPDGRFLSWVAYKDHQMCLWSNDGNYMMLEGHIGAIEDVHVFPDGRLLSRSDENLRLWAGDGRSLAVLDGGIAGFLGGIEIVPDGRFLSYNYQNPLRLWACDGKSQAVLETDGMYIHGFCFFPDGRFLAWGGGIIRDESELRLWAGDGKLLAVMTAPPSFRGEIHSLPNGRFVSRTTTGGQLWENDGRLVTSSSEDLLSIDPVAWLSSFSKFSLGELYDDNAVCLEGIEKDLLWYGQSSCWEAFLRADGVAGINQRGGQVCILQTYMGNRRVTLDELKRGLLLASASDHLS